MTGKGIFSRRYQAFIAVGLYAMLSGVAFAKYIGCDPPVPDIRSWTMDRSGTMISLTEANLIERQSACGVNCSACTTCRMSSADDTHGIRLAMTYNSRDADGSRAQLDTVMGYGWTHSYNIFLFSQLSSMFRYDGEGRVTKYKIDPAATFQGTGPFLPVYRSDTGYFETLVKNADGTFTLTQKDKTRYTFASIPSTPFLVGGPVYRLTQIVDRNSDTVTLSYTGGNLTSISDTYGRTMTLTYNAQRKLVSVTDPLGRTTAFTYDSTGRKLTTITDALGKKTQYTYNFLYQLTTKVDRDGRVYTYSYAGTNPIGSTDGSGASNFSQTNSSNWSTDATALAMNQCLVYVPSTTAKTDGRGNVWNYQYDSRGYVNQMTVPDAATTQYSYDSGTVKVSSITDANAHTTSYTYDSQGNPTQTTDALGHVTMYTYEPVFNMMTSITDPRTRVTQFQYDANGNRIQLTDALNQTEKWTYDAHGNVLSNTDKRMNNTSYQYDGQGNQIKITDPLQNVTTMTYDAVGNMTSRTDCNNHTTTYQYDGLNRQTVVTDPAGKTTQTFYDGEGDRIQTIDRNNHSTSFQYDLRRRLVKTVDALNQTETNAYDGNNNRLMTTDKNLHTSTFQYDVQDRLTQTADALGNTTVTMYDPVGNVTIQTDANGHTTHYDYDPLNRRMKTTDAENNVTQFQYDGGDLGVCRNCGATPGSSLLTRQTDANGKVTYFKYDALDRSIDVVRKEGDTADVIDSSDAVTSYTYDPNNNRTSLTEPNGNVTMYQYDALNRRTKETNAAGDVTMMSYDCVGNETSITAPNGNITTTVYDALDRPINVADSIGAIVSYSYDAVGNRLTQTDGNGNTTTYAYDAIDRLITVTDPLGKVTVSQYDPVGNLVRITDRNANVTIHTYDAIDRRISTQDVLGNVNKYDYDGVGNLTKLTDANSNATSYSYDKINRPSQESYADGKSRVFTYDGVGNVSTRTDQKGQVTTYTYNDLYFLLQRSYPVSPSDNYSYDLSGRMLTGQRAAWLVTFTYDGANRVTQTGQAGRTVNYVYDIPGRTRQLAYPSARTITESMDARSRLDHIDDGGSPPPIVQYTYDLANRILARSYRNGTAGTYTYNANDWILSLEHSNGSSRIAGFGYTYDNEGNKNVEEKRHDTSHSEAYQYDGIYRLIDYKVGTLVGSTVPVPLTQTAYNLDPVGNWNSKTTDAVTQLRAHNSVNELTKIDATNVTYDDDGNLIGDGAYAYTYDEENRLTMVTRTSDSALVGQYQYDALGRRVAKVANPAGSPTTTLYFYDGVRIIEEQDGVGATQATYVYGGDYVDEVLTMDRAGQTYYYHQNALWSVEAITNGAASVIERYAYDAYGQPSISDGSGVPVPQNTWGTPHSAIGNPWMFTGRQLDEEVGLYLYRARYYDYVKGRFLQRDPLGYVDGMNLYEYVESNPTLLVDPLGWLVSIDTKFGLWHRVQESMVSVADKSKLFGQLTVTTDFDCDKSGNVTLVTGPGITAKQENWVRGTSRVLSATATPNNRCQNGRRGYAVEIVFGSIYTRRSGAVVVGVTKATTIAGWRLGGPLGAAIGADVGLAASALGLLVDRIKFPEWNATGKVEYQVCCCPCPKSPGGWGATTLDVKGSVTTDTGHTSVGLIQDTVFCDMASDRFIYSHHMLPTSVIPGIEAGDEKFRISSGYGKASIVRAAP